MPLVLAHNVNVATHLTSNISIAVRTSTTSSTVSVPIAAIAGGTAAGVVLAVVAVMGWRWWTSIVRNTNKRQSSGQSVLRRRSRHIPTILNEELPASSTDRNSAESSDCKKDLTNSPLNTITSPHPTTPHQHSLITAASTLPGPPIKSPKNPARTMRRPSKESTARGSRASFVRASNRLSRKSSTISTASMYSTQSEEQQQQQQQTRVPAAAIVAALGHTRRLSTLNQNSEPYTIGEEEVELTIPRPRQQLSAYSNGVGQMHRISNISDGSLGLQRGSQSTAPIGVAYGGEESEEPFHEKWLVTEESDVPEGSLDHEIAPPGGHSTGLH